MPGISLVAQDQMFSGREFTYAPLYGFSNNLRHLIDNRGRQCAFDRALAESITISETVLASFVFDSQPEDEYFWCRVLVSVPQVVTSYLVFQFRMTSEDTSGLNTQTSDALNSFRTGAESVMGINRLGRTMKIEYPVTGNYNYKEVLSPWFRHQPNPTLGDTARVIKVIGKGAMYPNAPIQDAYLRGVSIFATNKGYL